MTILTMKSNKRNIQEMRSTYFQLQILFENNLSLQEIETRINEFLSNYHRSAKLLN